MRLPKTYYDARTCPVRFQVHEGGTRSGKTYSILTVLAELCWTNKGQGLFIDVTRVNGPAIEAGPLRDWRDILDRHGWLTERAQANPRLREYRMWGNTVSFFSVDQAYKMRGRKRDVLFMNEANRFSYDAFQQLNMRTTGRVIMDYNPDDVDHWLYDKVLTRANARLFHSTYRDNPFLPQSMVREIEAMKATDDWYWRVYGLGERAANPAQIYRAFTQVPALPEEVTDELGRTRPPKPLCIGLDFGFSVDPTAAVALYEGATRPGAPRPDVYVDQLLYQTGLTNPDLAALLREAMSARDLDPATPVVCDSADPKSIEELRRLGLNAWPSTKGADSVRQGIQLVQQFRLLVTQASGDWLKEAKAYKWTQDRNGRPLGKPVDAHNHLMDAMRYGLDYHYNRRYDATYAVA